MSFLDRFKPQPRWKHADATVRAAAVAEMLSDDPEQQRALVELAGTDEDVRVRRAAMARVDGVEDLVQLARSEHDEDLRRGLSERLVGIATAAGDSDGPAARALDGLDDQKQLATVAKSSPHETVRAAALGRVHDVRTLSSVARHALDPLTAFEAASRVADAPELLNVALKTDHKEAGIAALERMASGAAPAEVRNTLELVAGRAKNKSVSKRARMMLQSIEETEAAERAALEQWRQGIAAVLARVSALAAAPVAGDTRVQLADAEIAVARARQLRQLRCRSGYQRPLWRLRRRSARRDRALRSGNGRSARRRRTARQPASRQAGTVRPRRRDQRRGGSRRARSGAW